MKPCVCELAWGKNDMKKIDATEAISMLAPVNITILKENFKVNKTKREHQLWMHLVLVFASRSCKRRKGNFQRKSLDGIYKYNSFAPCENELWPVHLLANNNKEVFCISFLLIVDCWFSKSVRPIFVILNFIFAFLKNRELRRKKHILCSPYWSYAEYWDDHQRSNFLLKI